MSVDIVDSVDCVMVLYRRRCSISRSTRLGDGFSMLLYSVIATSVTRQAMGINSNRNQNVGLHASRPRHSTVSNDPYPQGARATR
jgi:hypothetical protein